MRLNKSDLIYFLQHQSEYYTNSNEFIDVWYFSKVLNVGDLVGPYLLEKLTDKKARKNIFGLRSHYLSVGSILDQVTKQSIVWGPGFLRKEDELRYHPAKISLVRGKLTKRKLPTQYRPALGDPALALSQFYSPQPSSNKKPIGIVLHYSDDHLRHLFTNQENIKLINVAQGVESFIDEIISCDVILSSSLHGLIIADAYQVKNCWIKFDTCKRNDNFKYYDYFSIFSNNTPQDAITINTSKPFTLPNLVGHCRTRNIEPHSTAIINSFELND